MTCRQSDVVADTLASSGTFLFFGFIHHEMSAICTQVLTATNGSGRGSFRAVVELG
jgi:hypothetical protein